MKRYNQSAAMKGDVIDAKAFSELMVTTYKKNLEARKRKERAKTY